MSKTDATPAADRGSECNDLLGAWLPIATAPRDGTEVLLWVWGKRVVGAWLPYSDSSYPILWQDHNGRAIVRPWKDDEEPEFWSALPEAPNVAINLPP